MRSGRWIARIQDRLQVRDWKITARIGATTLVTVLFVMCTAVWAHSQLSSAHPGTGEAVIDVMTGFCVCGFAVVAQGYVFHRGASRQIHALLRELERLKTGVTAGRIDARCEPGTVAPDLQPVLAAVNEAIDVFVAPILVAADCVERMSRGDIPGELTEEYRGDFEQLRQNLNLCLRSVKGLVADADMLASAAVAGSLATRADPERHEGDFRRIIDGVNHALDAVVAPVGEATQVLERLARRDLRARVRGDYPGDHAKMKVALNATAEALHAAVVQVADATRKVAHAADRIAVTSGSVARGASEQGKALDATAASVGDMVSMVQKSAEGAGHAECLAGGARETAMAGSTAMQDMANAMTRIRSSAEGTSQIIKVINEIAFQTNLLSLNAAVEAARAGEAGRGFAVVADEVRTLALRSKEAANDTEALIRQSVKEAQQGHVAAAAVAGKLSEIVRSVAEVTGIVTDISAGATRTARSLDSVAEGIEYVRRVTQLNATSSEESSAAAAQLSGQSEELAAMVETFQLDGSPALAVPTADAGATRRSLVARLS